jgi:hypothetical protein
VKLAVILRPLYEANAVWQARRKKEGRPRLKWLGLDDVEDLRETEVRRWRTKAVDRNEWQRILEEA